MKKLPILLFVFFVGASVYGQSDSANHYFEKGMAEKQAKRFREAEKNFAKANKFDPSSLPTLLELGAALLEQKRYSEAREKFLEAEKIDANNSLVVENLSTLSFNMRKYEDCIKYAKKMQEKKIGTGSHFLIAKSYYELENYGEALKYCELAFKDDPKNAQIPYIGGRCYMEMSNYKKSAGCYEQAIALDSSNAVWMYEAGLMYYAIPNDQKALYWIEKAGQNGIKKTDDYMENLASAYLNAGKHDEGINILKEILQRKPEDQEVLYSIGESYYKIKKYDEAISYWDKAFGIDKTNASALYMIGMAYQKKGETDKGRAMCDRAIQMDPSLAKLKEERKMPGGL